jgi:hypothetical protein
MDLAVLIVSWNVRDLLSACLHSVSRSLTESASAPDGMVLETGIWVVDNQSADGTAEMLAAEFPAVNLLLNPENLGFAAANNRAMIAAVALKPRYLLLLNPDTEVRGRALETLVRFLDTHPLAGMAGAHLINADGSLQHSAFRFPGLIQLFLDLYPAPPRLLESSLNGRYPRRRYRPGADPFAVDHTLGAAMCLRAELVDTVGMLDTSYFMYCEEIDWAIRIRAAGWQVFCVPAAEIVHYGGQSSSQVRPSSLLHLWHSRHTLYSRHGGPIKMWLAQQLVRRAMSSRTRRESSPALRVTYQQIQEIWR